MFCITVILINKGPTLRNFVPTKFECNWQKPLQNVSFILKYPFAIIDDQASVSNAASIVFRCI